jgi:enamine deaminase RidA (YjgF/YER057c/UK114 family)
MLEDVGAKLSDVCWLQIFVTNIDDRLAMDPVRRRFFGEADLPAATMVEVSRLALPGAVVEVNAIAVVEDR